MSHTPKPWKVCNHSWAETSILDASGNAVCRLSIEDECDEDTQEEWERIMDERAHQIAAVPELLEALVLCNQIMEAKIQPGEDGAPSWTDVIRKTEAAIAKAKGAAK